MSNLKTIIAMELIFLAGLSIPALTLTLLMVSFYQSVKKINFGFKKPQRTLTYNTFEKKQLRDPEKKSDFKHVDFSDGLLGL